MRGGTPVRTVFRVLTAALLRRWADDVLRRRVLDLNADLEAERRRNRVLQVECDALAEVIVRDRARVQAETADHIRKTVGES
jgi:hypothetical protein